MVRVLSVQERKRFIPEGYVGAGFGEKLNSAVEFLRALLTDNACSYRSRQFRHACQQMGVLIPLRTLVRQDFAAVLLCKFWKNCKALGTAAASPEA
jgi:hypothetical protein